MRIDVLTIFPDLVRAHVGESLLGRAAERGLVDVAVHDLRIHGRGRHHQVDDTVFGGGPGMVLRPDVVADALDALPAAAASARRIAPMPAGTPLRQPLLHALAAEASVTLLCGRYEGVDQRVLDAYGFEPVSLGDYVIAGGELAALVLVEGVVRLLPGVMGNAASGWQESFEDGLLEPPVFTRPAEWRGHDVPDVLRSGDHAAIATWRRHEAIRATAALRPDLLRDAVAAGLVARNEVDDAIGAGATLPGPRSPQESP